MSWRSKAERMTVKSVSAKSEDKKKEAGEIYKDQKKEMMWGLRREGEEWQAGNADGLSYCLSEVVIVL